MTWLSKKTFAPKFIVLMLFLGTLSPLKATTFTSKQQACRRHLKETVRSALDLKIDVNTTNIIFSFLENPTVTLRIFCCIAYSTAYNAGSPVYTYYDPEDVHNQRIAIDIGVQKIEKKRWHNWREDNNHLDLGAYYYSDDLQSGGNVSYCYVSSQEIVVPRDITSSIDEKILQDKSEQEKWIDRVKVYGKAVVNKILRMKRMHVFDDNGGQGPEETAVLEVFLRKPYFNARDEFHVYPKSERYWVKVREDLRIEVWGQRNCTIKPLAFYPLFRQMSFVRYYDRSCRYRLRNYYIRQGLLLADNVFTGAFLILRFGNLYGRYVKKDHMQYLFSCFLQKFFPDQYSAPVSQAELPRIPTCKRTRSRFFRASCVGLACQAALSYYVTSKHLRLFEFIMHSDVYFRTGLELLHNQLSWYFGN